MLAIVGEDSELTADLPNVVEAYLRREVTASGVKFNRQNIVP